MTAPALTPARLEVLDRVCDPVPRLIESARDDADLLRGHLADDAEIGGPGDEHAEHLACLAARLTDTIEKLVGHIGAGGDRRLPERSAHPFQPPLSASSEPAAASCLHTPAKRRR